MEPAGPADNIVATVQIDAVVAAIPLPCTG